MTPRKEATLSCCSRYSGDRKLREYRLPTKSTSTMQPNADATAGSKRRRTPTAALPEARRSRSELRASTIELETVADAQEAQRSEADCRHQHRPLKERLPQR